jgi:hypothetical protein
LVGVKRKDVSFLLGFALHSPRSNRKLCRKSFPCVIKFNLEEWCWQKLRISLNQYFITFGNPFVTETR